MHLVNCLLRPFTAEKAAIVLNIAIYSIISKGMRRHSDSKISEFPQSGREVYIATVEYSLAQNNQSRQIFNYAIAFGQTNSVPIFTKNTQAA